MKQRSFFLTLTLFAVITIGLGCGGGGGKGGGSASISGTVEDYSYDYLEGVKIDVGGKASAITDQYGDFQTGKFPLGKYKMTFSKEGYWTLSFDVIFNQSGSFIFSDNIYLSEVINGSGPEVGPSFIKDLNYNEKHLTINAANKVRTLIALVYNDESFQSFEQSHINITTDTGNSFSATIANQKFSATGQTQNDPYQRLREFNRKIDQEMKNKGIKPGWKPSAFSVMPAENTLTFYKLNFDNNNSFSKVTANKEYEGEHCLIYLDNKQTISDTYINKLGKTFDGFYDTMISNFGDLTIDVDSYPKVYILLSELYHGSDGTILGYFHGINEYPKSETSYSNEKEMIYLTTYTYNSDPEAWLKMVESTAAHEFQHLISFSCREGSKKDGLPTWMNEGLSLVAEDIAISGAYQHNPELDARIKMYLKYHAYDSLQAWDNTGLDYGSAYMFMRYYADRYGENKLKDINNLNDHYVTDYDLASIAGVSDFDYLFRDWLTAVALDSLGYSTSDPDETVKYLYRTLDLTAYDFPKEPQGYIQMSTGAGAFIVMPNLESTSRINLTFDRHYSTQLRLIMLPANGATFQKKSIPDIIRVR